jgi:hypothetical protein
VATPFGADTGGVNPTFFSYSPQAQYDSWLTLGITTGDQAAKISSIGMAFDIWNEQNALLSAPDTGGSVFWMDPDQVSRRRTRGTLVAVTPIRAWCCCPLQLPEP